MKKLFTSLLLFMISYQATWSAVGDTFTANTVEGIEMTFTEVYNYGSLLNCIVGTAVNGTIPSGPAISTSVSGIVTIPETVNGYKVIGIGTGAFDDCRSLTAVSIPNSIEYIGSSAFYGCYGLKSITIPLGVKSIWGSAFYNCKNLKVISLPKSLNSIDGHAFYGCNNITKVYCYNPLPPATTTSDYCWPSYFENDVTLSVPYGSVGAYQADEGWSVFNVVEEQASMDNIITFADEKVKENCVSWYDTNHDGELSEAEAAAVTDDEELFRIVGSNNPFPFEELKFFTGLARIDNDYTLLFSSVIIPRGVTYIGDRAFSLLLNPNLKTIAVDKDNLFYDSRDNCNAVIRTATNEMIIGTSSTVIPSSVTSIRKAFRYCTDLTSIIIPEGVTDMAGAFSDCSNLKTIVIPSSMTNINNAFDGCDYLLSIVVNAEQPLVLNGNTFCRFNTANVNLYVPQGCKAAYASADYWKDFKNIYEVGYNGTVDSELTGETGIACFTVYKPGMLKDLYVQAGKPNKVKIIGEVDANDLDALVHDGYYNEIYYTSYVDLSEAHINGCSGFYNRILSRSEDCPDNYLDSRWMFATISENDDTDYYGPSIIVLPTTLQEYVGINCLPKVIYSEQTTPFKTTITNPENCSKCIFHVPSGTRVGWIEKTTYPGNAMFMDGPSKNVNITTAGTLASLLTEDEIESLNELSITGYINAKDFAVLKRMSNLVNLSVSAQWEAYEGNEGPVEGQTSYRAGEVPAYVFQNHANLESVSLFFYGQQGLLVGDYAFDGCTRLSTFDCKGVSSLGDFCFRNTKVQGLTLLGVNVKDDEGDTWTEDNHEFEHIGLQPFFGVKGHACFNSGDYQLENYTVIPSYYQTIYSGVTNKAESLLYALSTINDWNMTLPNSITTIADYAVSGLQIRSINLSSVTTIGDGFLYQCPLLQSITCDNTAYKAVDGVLYTADRKMLVKYPCAKTAEELTIPSTVEQISKWAFEGTQNLNSIIIEASTPPTLAEGAFDDFDVTTITLNVPAGCKAAYEAADYWKDFNIVEMAAPVAVVPESTVLPWGTQHAWEMKYVFFENTDSEPEADGSGHAWYEEEYNDESWHTLSGPIANLDNHFSTVNTIWNTNNVSSCYYLRRTFTLNQVDEQGYTFLSQHDDDLKVWLNGELVIEAPYDGTIYCHHIPASKFHEGDNTLAISVNDFGGEAFLDYSLGHLFFLKNVETEKYLNAGNEWGTHAVLADEPLPVQLFKQPDGSYTIFVPLKSWYQHLLFMEEDMSNVFVDYQAQESPACRYWTITDAGNGNYHIQTLGESDTYLGNDPDREPANDVDGDVSIDKNITWSLVREGVHTAAQAERLQELINQANALNIDTSEAQTVLANENATYTVMLAQILLVDGSINGGMWFEDEKVKELCIANWDTNEDGELSRLEAGAVTSLGEVFKGNTEITSFNELQCFTGLTSIGCNAFNKCTNLKSVMLPEGLTTIEGTDEDQGGAFARTGLEAIQFPSALMTIGSLAFQACENLKSIDFNGCTATIEGDAFSWLNSLEEITIPSTITLTGWFTFAGCGNLKTVTIEEGNPSEGLCGTFGYSNTSIETVVLPSTTILGEMMFEGCSKLKSVTFLSGDPGEKHFANNFQGCPDDVLFTIPEGTAENYLKKGYRNLSDKGALGKVKDLFENQVEHIYEIAYQVEDGEWDNTLNTAKDAAYEIVNATDDYLTVYAQIEAMKDAAKTFLVSAPLTADLDVTAAMITNSDNDFFDIGWNVGFLGFNNGWQDQGNYSNSDNCSILNFLEGWKPSEVLNSGKHWQIIKNMPAGKYRLTAKAIATWQDDSEQEVTGVSLYIGDQNVPVATANEKPEYFSVEFTNTETQNVEIGLKVEGTTANWVALDDVHLVYEGEATDPLGAKLTADNVKCVAGSMTTFNVNLLNRDEVTAFQFEVELPEGVSIYEENGTLEAQLTTRGNGHSFGCIKTGENTYQFTAMSLGSKSFKKNEGPIVRMTLTTDATLQLGGYPIKVKNTELSKPDGMRVQPSDFTSTLTIKEADLGDVNGDGKITVTDAVYVYKKVNGETPEHFQQAAADLNRDNNITINDAVLIVNMVLNNSQPMSTRSAKRFLEQLAQKY